MPTRTIFLEPTAESAPFEQFTKFGSSEAVYKILAKGVRQPTAPSEASGIESSTIGQGANVIFEPEKMPLGLGQGEHIKNVTFWFYAKAATASAAMEGFITANEKSKAEKVKGVTAKWWKSQFTAKLGVASPKVSWEGSFGMLLAEKCSVYACYVEVLIEYPTIISEFVESEWLEEETSEASGNKINFGGQLTPSVGNNVTAVIATAAEKGATEVTDGAGAWTLDAEAKQAGINIQVWSAKVTNELLTNMTATFPEPKKLVSITCYEWSGFKLAAYVATKGAATGESLEPAAKTEGVLDAEGDMVLYAEANVIPINVVTKPTGYELLTLAKKTGRALSAGAAFNNTPEASKAVEPKGKNSKTGKWVCVVIAYRAQTEPVVEFTLQLNQKDKLTAAQGLAPKLTSKIEWKDSFKAAFTITAEGKHASRFIVFYDDEE